MYKERGGGKRGMERWGRKLGGRKERWKEGTERIHSN
jgi:hypothetical protein